MPDSLKRAIQQVLRHWHMREPSGPPWTEMVIVIERLAKEPTSTVGQAVKQLLLEALDELSQQIGDDPAQLLRWRYLDDLKAYAVANRLNVSDNVVFKEQRAAINALTELVWQAESKARQTRIERILGRLNPSPPVLFGITEKLSNLSHLLTASGPPYVIAVVGIGGIGKTTLAEAVVRAMGTSASIADVVWISARQETYTVWDGLHTSEASAALTAGQLFDEIIEQLGLEEASTGSPAGERARVRARLRAHRYLIVIDNLETAADYRALIPELLSLSGPAKFLLTSRHSLYDYPGVHNLPLDELSQADSLALLRSEAEGRGLADVAAAPDETLLEIYAVTGGNPLALKLLIGQMYTLSLREVVEGLCQAKGQTIEDLYRFIYWRSWHLLSSEAQQVLATLPVAAAEVSGTKAEYLATLTGLAFEQVMEALKQLATLSLVNVRGMVESRRYSLHRLTETFLLHEVAKWQKP